MKNSVSRAAFCATALLVLSLAGRAAPAEEPLAIVGANVIPMDEERVLPAHTVIVTGGRIVALGPMDGIEIPDVAQRIEAEGMYLIPGLNEMHAHIPSNDREFTRRVLALFVANGVTGIRGMLGHPSHLELRDAVERGVPLGPRIVTSGPSLNGNSVGSADQAARMVREQHAAGYDFVKLHPGLELDEYLEVARAARALDMPFAGHVSLAVGVPATLAAGQATIDHLDGYMQALVPPGTAYTEAEQRFFGLGLASSADTARIAPLAAATARTAVRNVPTQTLIENFSGKESPGELAARPEMRYMPPSMVRRWREAVENFQASPAWDARTAQEAVAVRRALIAGLHAAGAGILLGSDAPQVFNVPGFSLHRELAAYVDAGLSPYDALAAGTVRVAEHYGERGEAGVVGAGARADLVLLEASPLDDIANTRRIAGVVLRGQWYPRERLDELLAQYDESGGD